MDCSCIRHTDIPGTTLLFADYLYHPDRVRSFYAYPERSPADLEDAARNTALAEDRRAALVAALRPDHPGSRSLDVLAQPGTVAVVTGQQVGLFSGPAYTVYKAVTAVRLARDLTARGIPAVPVFWLATEDHDFAEVNHCWVFDGAGRPVRLEAGAAAAPGRPVGELAIEPPLAQLRAALDGLPFGSEMAGAVEDAYRPGRTMGQAFAALMRILLARYDLIYLDPMNPALRALAAPVVRRAVEQAPELGAALLERNRALAAAGYHAQVHVEEGTSLVFLLENGRRLALHRYGHEYALNGRRFSASELAARAHELSPNALLRPVVQDSLLPTAAYVGGPAELAYLAQSETLYRALLGRMPVAVPRAAFTLLDAHSRKVMERFGLQLPELFHGEEALRERIAARLIPSRLETALAETRATVEGAIGRLGAELRSFDPTLAAAIEKNRAKMLYQLAKSGRKIGREMLARDARAGAESVRLSNLVYPERHLQERLYSILPFLARHGPEMLDALYEAADAACPDHRTAVL